MTDVQELDGVDWESCTLTRYDNDYQNAKESLEGLQNIVFYRHCGGIGDLFPGAGSVPDAAAPWAESMKPASIWPWAFPKARCCCNICWK